MRERPGRQMSKGKLSRITPAYAGKTYLARNLGNEEDHPACERRFVVVTLSAGTWITRVCGKDIRHADVPSMKGSPRVCEDLEDK